MNDTIFVGPILIAGEIADAIILAIQRINRHVSVQDRGAYLHVSVPKQCLLTRETLEDTLGHPFLLPNDLEKVLLSSQGKLTITTDKAVWKITTEVE